ncbi:MAG: hypothetical protein ACREV6_17535 [Clostridium sp.]|uniref:hypothetical protein n=1 Tax=Clostridium sp. TaxID=1506 RepID=UPI003D6CE345
MKKFLSLLCIGTLSIGSLVGCSNTNTSQTVEVQNNKNQIVTKATKNKFGVLEIKKILVEANSWMDDWLNGSFKTTNQTIGLVNGKYIVKKIESSKYPNGKEFKKLKKYYSQDVIKKELAMLGLVYIDGELGRIQGLTFCEATCVTENSKMKLLVDEENRKVVNVEKVSIDNIDNIDSNFDLENCGIKYELCKDEKGQWIISKEEGYMNTDYIIKKIN